jgi:DNA-binding GntR family transcriptional regulator
MIEIVRCSADQAGLLAVPRGAPALLVASVTFDQDDRAVEYSRVVYREDRFRFSLESHRRDGDVRHVIPAEEGKWRN